MLRRHALQLLAAASASAIALPRAVLGQTPAPVRLGQVGLSFYAVTGAVVQEVLERLGHSVEVLQGPHEEMFPKLGAGEVDLFAAAWLPNGHAAYWSRYGDRAVELATLYEGAHFFWGVPDYVPADEVRSVEDLSRPEIAARMTKTIQGIGPGAGITVLSLKMMDDYRLKDAGYTFQTGTAPVWVKAYVDAVAEKRWVVIPLWKPQWLNRAYSIRALEEPKGILAGRDRAALVATKEAAGRMPARTVEVLRRVSLGLDGVTEMDHAVNVEKKSPRDAARAWMAANAGRVEGWFRT